MSASLRADANGTLAAIQVAGVDRLLLDSSGNLTGTTTPVQFDNSLALASTAFVQRALGNYNSSTELSVNTTLLASDVGKQINLAAVSSFTVTLPLVSTVTNGGGFFFHSDSAVSAPITITCPGTDKIAIAGSLYSSMVINNGEFAMLYQQAGVWRTAGSAVLKNEAQFGSSLATNGYQKLPSGLIIQWGTFTANASVGAALAITFPVSFNTAIRSLSLSQVNNGVTTTQSAWADSATLSGFNGRASTASTQVNYTVIGY